MEEEGRRRKRVRRETRRSERKGRRWVGRWDIERDEMDRWVSGEKVDWWGEGGRSAPTKERGRKGD